MNLVIVSVWHMGQSTSLLYRRRYIVFSLSSDEEAYFIEAGRYPLIQTSISSISSLWLELKTYVAKTFDLVIGHGHSDLMLSLKSTMGNNPLAFISIQSLSDHLIPIS